MFRGFPKTGAVLAAACASLLAAALTNRLAPAPAADVSRGSEEAFASGLHAREVPPGRTPLRWTTDRARFLFRHLPAGPATLEVRLRTHRSPVTVLANGVILGVIDARAWARDFALPDLQRPTLAVELQVETFTASGGRRLGTQLDRVAVRHAPARLPPPGLLLLFLAPALGVVLGAVAVGTRPLWALLQALLVSAFQSLSLVPCGLVRSGYAQQLAILLVAGAVVAAAFAAWARRRFAGSEGWAFGALLAAFLVQGVAATAPVMVVSDALFHANKLEAVGRGDYFPTSVTQHARPFRFPYGVSFYLLLAPFVPGSDLVTLVRGGAAVAGVLASAGLFALLAAGGAARAALAVLLLQLLPGTFEVYSSGNLSNVFGQTTTVLFFAWWSGGTPGGWAVGASLVALSGLSHFGSLVVLVVLCASLAVERREALRHDRARLLALALGLGLVGLYYAQFWGLVAEQVPRLLEGGGQGKGMGRSPWSVLWGQARRLFQQWGAPAIALALLGLPRRSGGSLDRNLLGFWFAGAALGVAAIVSPLEVRYLYALTLPVAVAAARGFLVLSERGTPTKLLAWVLLAGQAALGVREIVEAVLVRYREPG